MARTLTYSDTAQVTKATADTVRAILFDWHDPSSGNMARDWTESPTVVDGEQVTDEDGNPMYDVSITGEIVDVPEDQIGTQKTNFVSAINNAFPEEWPTVAEGEIRIR